MIHKLVKTYRIIYGLNLPAFTLPWSPTHLSQLTVCDALASVGVAARVLDYTEHALTEGTDAQAAAYVECEIGGGVFWGVGIDANTATASMRAVLSAVNRFRRG